MNYIKQLQADKAELSGVIEKANQNLTNVLVYLSSNKFSGIDLLGESKDFVSAVEMFNTIREIRNELLNNVN